MNTSKVISYFKAIYRDDSEAEMTISDRDRPYCIDFCDEFSIFFLSDEGDSFHFLQEKHLETGDVTKAELLEIGINNLRKIANEITIQKHEDILYFSGSGNFEASLLLVPEIWDEWLPEHCPNGYIAAIPARDILVVCDKNNPEGKSKLNNIINKVWPDGDHLLSNKLFTYTNARWVQV